MGSVHMISSVVRYRACPCGATVLAALSEGEPVSADPAIVDSVTELAGLIKGRRSYDLRRIANRFELVHRDFSRMRHRDYPVVLEHPCRIVDVGDPQQWRKKTTPAAKSPPPSPAHIQPPF